MTVIIRIFTGIITGTVLTVLCFSYAAVGQERKPNILFIMTDQQHAGMMSAAGNRWLSTPHMDKLASRSVRFTKAYVTNPVCSPSRFSLLTGLYPSAINLRFNGSVIDETNLPEIMRSSMGFTFRNAGYDTYYGGKVHLPGGDASDYGFDSLITRDDRDHLAQTSSDFLLSRDSEKPFFFFVSFINPHDICFEAIRQHQPDSRAARLTPPELLKAIEIPDSLSEEKFFSIYCPPLPYNFEPTTNEPSAIQTLKTYHPFTIYARETWTERDWRLHRWAYHRLTENVDAQIGKVLAALDQSPFKENTIIVFTSDHGEMNGAHRLEHKTVFYEESSNVPLMVSLPGPLRSRKVDDHHLISTGLDIYPTLCELAEIKSPESLPGTSFASLLRNPGNYKPRKYLIMENEIGFLVRDHRYKYALYDNGDEMLIDLKTDPGEMVNLAARLRHRKVKDRLRERLEQYLTANKIDR